ncbi:hypothetical protein C5B85_12140 [Pseudoclavibacter sp. AY1F1]|uniref:hypothetical protein n=1 Tax=Pseudoclavibacter sp. AY1F1 TaxID=2080583 RepID=UPI000CE7A946|nr:hypothetical protein [Pseudoclavibacter sp. AY1F1]PPF43891.1 hypothetical protein C5B85_12140 [Pseudoclavibacter sp. AY1F1]
MSDDTRAPRQPFDDGAQPEAGGETGEPRELPDVQDQLEAALARSRGIGEDGDVASGEVLSGDDLAFDGRAEAPTDPALAPQEDVAVAFADPLAEEAGDPNATVGLDRNELAAVLADGPTGRSEAERADTDRASGLDPVQAPVATQDDPESGSDLGFDGVPVSERVVAEEDDAADFPVTEPVPAQDLAADAIGAESVAAITVDAAGSATAPDEVHDEQDEPDQPRRTLEIDRTAARVAAVGSTSPSEATPVAAPGDVQDDGAPSGVDGEAARTEAVVTETVTEQLAEDGEHVEAVTVTERVDLLDTDDVEASRAAEATGRDESDPSSTSDFSPSQDDLDASGLPDGSDASQGHSVAVGGAASSVALEQGDDEAREAREAEVTADTDTAATSEPSATPGATDDDSTFAPLRLSAPTDSDDLAPVKPKKRGNRMFAVFVALVASVVFAALYLLAFALLRTAFNTGLDPIGEASEFAITAAFTVPVTVFAAFGVLWALIVNRAGWWAYVLGGFLAAALVVAGYYFGAALQQHLAEGLPLTSIQLDEVLAKFRASEHLLTALVAAIAAREAFTWVGGIAAARGRRVAQANRRAKLSYEKRIAERAAETAEANGVTE